MRCELCLRVVPGGLDELSVALLRAGVYKPQIKVFEVDQLSQKFERHVVSERCAVARTSLCLLVWCAQDSEIVQFQFLADDFSKMTLLRSDRTVRHFLP